MAEERTARIVITTIHEDKFSDPAKESLEETQSRLKKFQGFVNGVMGVAFVGTMARAGKAMLDLASQIELDTKKIEIVFGGQIGVVDKWAAANANAMGLTRREAKLAAVGVADLLVPLNFTRKEATQMAIDVADLSGVIAEWSPKITDASHASDVLSKALLGETEALKTAGISIDQSSKAFNERIKVLQRDKKLTLEQAKATDIMNQIMSKSKDAQTAFRNGADTLARRQAVVNARFKEWRESLAQSLSGEFGKFISNVDWLGRALDELIPGFNKVTGQIFKFISPLTLFNDILSKIRVSWLLLTGEQEEAAKVLAQTNKEFEKQLKLAAEAAKKAGINNDLVNFFTAKTTAGGDSGGAKPTNTAGKGVGLASLRTVQATDKTRLDRFGNEVGIGPEQRGLGALGIDPIQIQTDTQLLGGELDSLEQQTTRNFQRMKSAAGSFSDAMQGAAKVGIGTLISELDRAIFVQKKGLDKILGATLTAIGTEAMGRGAVKLADAIFPPNPALAASGFKLIGVGLGLKGLGSAFGGGSGGFSSGVGGGGGSSGFASTVRSSGPQRPSGDEIHFHFDGQDQVIIGENFEEFMKRNAQWLMDQNKQQKFRLG